MWEANFLGSCIVPVNSTSKRPSRELIKSRPKRTERLAIQQSE